MYRNILTAAILSALVAPALASTVNQTSPQPATGEAVAQSAQPPAQTQQTTGSQSKTQSKGTTKTKTPSQKNATKLKAITVLGSLIPQSQVSTATPVITITSTQIKLRAFSSVTQALQSASFALGGVQGPQTSGGFTQGAQTLSFFQLPIGFTKYLINGRPMGDYPALYNGSTAFNNISGIPQGLIQRVEILPGGQSSLYGSDAIGGVINFVLKKHITHLDVDVRYGWFPQGGGANRRLSLSDGVTFGKLDIMGGIQVASKQPMWGYSRAITSQYYNGAFPDLPGGQKGNVGAGRLVYNVLNSTGIVSPITVDPNHCAALSGLWRGTEQEKFLNGLQFPVCGSAFSPGYHTITNGAHTGNAYVRATFTLNPDVKFYSDLLYKYQRVRYSAGSNFIFWASDFAQPGFYHDPRLPGTFPVVQETFAPESMPDGYTSTLSTNYSNSYFFDLGVHGYLGQSNWGYDLSVNRSYQKLLQDENARNAKAVDDFFENQLGMTPADQLGTYYGYPVYEPNYQAMYQKPIPVSAFRSWNTYASNHSHTWKDDLRLQITNDDLFELPGGDAGVAAQLEGGNQGWDYSPDPGFAKNVFWGLTSSSGNGHRSRWAATGEVRLPFFKFVTLDMSGRQDNFHIANHHTSKSTYSLGLEIRPFSMLLLRARYGTAFKVPTLPALFQAPSGFFSFVTDYLRCAELGFEGNQLSNCPDNSVQYKGNEQGNPNLKPIDANVWSYGFVFSPTGRLSVSADYYHTNVKNQTTSIPAGTLSLQQLQCHNGILDMNSPTCKNAFSAIVRGPTGANNVVGVIKSITTQKVNLADIVDNAILARLHWSQSLGSIGTILVDGSYSRVLHHTFTQFAGDTPQNELTDPLFFNGYSHKSNISLTWQKDKWTVTAFRERFGGFVPTNGWVTWAGDSTKPEALKKYAGTREPAWVLYNASVIYHVTPKFSVAFMGQNIFGKMPPNDHTFPNGTAVPYYTSLYNPYGRQYFVEVNYQFGDHSS